MLVHHCHNCENCTSLQPVLVVVRSLLQSGWVVVQGWSVQFDDVALSCYLHEIYSKCTAASAITAILNYNNSSASTGPVLKQECSHAAISIPQSRISILGVHPVPELTDRKRITFPSRQQLTEGMD